MISSLILCGASTMETSSIMSALETVLGKFEMRTTVMFFTGAPFPRCRKAADCTRLQTALCLATSLGLQHRMRHRPLARPFVGSLRLRCQKAAQSKAAHSKAAVSRVRRMKRAHRGCAGPSSSNRSFFHCPSGLPFGITASFDVRPFCSMPTRVCHGGTPTSLSRSL